MGQYMHVRRRAHTQTRTQASHLFVQVFFPSFCLDGNVKSIPQNFTVRSVTSSCAGWASTLHNFQPRSPFQEFQGET